MRVTYAGTVLSTDTFAAGETWQTSFRVSGAQQNQVAHRTRAEYITLFARGGRSHTIDLLFIPPPAADVHEAFEQLSLYFSALPLQGDLVLLSGALERTFPDACVQAFSPPPRRGLANEFPVTFLAGAVTAATLSPLAQMDSRYPNIRPITGLTGGDSGKLDAEITADVAVNRVIKFYLVESSILVPHEWVLLDWTDEVEDAAAGVVIPDDWHVTTNPKYWHRTM